MGGTQADRSNEHQQRGCLPQASDSSDLCVTNKGLLTIIHVLAYFIKIPENFVPLFLSSQKASSAGEGTSEIALSRKVH